MMRLVAFASLPRMSLLVGVVLVAAVSGSATGSSTTAPPEAPTTLPTTATPSLALEQPSPSASPSQRHLAIGIPVFGPDGALYSTDCGAGVVVRLLSPTTARIVAGVWHGDDPLAPGASPFGDGGPAASAQLVCPTDVAFDSQGRLLIVDHGHNRIRRVDADGTIETIVGAASPPVPNGGDFAGDGRAAVDAHLNSPTRIVFDAAGNLYISDRDNNRVRKVAPGGTITTLAGNGTPTFGGDGGAAADASLNYPLQLAVAANGDVYIADDNNNRIREVSTTGIISTVIGDGSFGSGGDGGPASEAQVNDAQGVVFDASGNLYVSEYGGNRIRRIDPSGIVTTIAGTGEDGLEGMGGPAIDARIPQPGKLTIGPDGALYVEDQEAPTILRIDLVTGIVTVAAGGPDGVSEP